MSDATGGKRCTRCEAVQPLTLFGVSRQRADGLKPWCKPCSTAHLKAWSAANPEKVAARSARYHAKHKAANNAKSAAYRAANPESTAAAIDRWHAAHPDARRMARLAWAKRNPEYGAASAARRRAVRAEATPSWAGSEFEELVLAEAYRLAPLRSKLTGVLHHVDHKVPLQGRTVRGFHCAANLQVIPADANRSKSNRAWPDMP